MTTEFHTWSEVPREPAVYVMYGGWGERQRWPAYVGITGNLNDRLLQHFDKRDSSVVTGVAAAGINIDAVREVRWWLHQDFVDTAKRHAAERLAFKFFDPALRSRAGLPTSAKPYLEAEEFEGFRESIRQLFRSDPDGKLHIPHLWDLDRRIRRLEERLAAVESWPRENPQVLEGNLAPLDPMGVPNIMPARRMERRVKGAFHDHPFAWSSLALPFGLPSERAESLRICLSETAVLLVLYIAGFGLQIAGVVLVVLEIAGDVRAAKTIKSEADAPDPPKVFRRESPGLVEEISGPFAEQVMGTAQSVDSFRDFTAERLSGGLRRRMLGVVLFVAGAFVGLAASLVATL